MMVAWNRKKRGFILEIKKWRESRRNKKALVSFRLRKCSRIYLLPSCTDKPPYKSVNWWGILWWAWLQRGGTQWVAFVHICALVNTRVCTHTLLCMVKTTVSMAHPSVYCATVKEALGFIPLSELAMPHYVFGAVFCFCLFLYPPVPGKSYSLLYVFTLYWHFV